MNRKVACGVVAGPLFVSVFTVVGARRAGYDWRRHAVSSLAVGREGRGQRANFMIVGGLYCVAARGLARSPSRVVGPTVIPALVFAAGVGLIGSGLFVTDPVAGFPPSALPPAPSTQSYRSRQRAAANYTTCARSRSSSVFPRRPWSARDLPSAEGSTGGQRIALAQRLAWLAHVRSSGRHSVARRRSFPAEVSSSASRSQPDSDGSAPSHSARCAQRRKVESQTSPGGPLRARLPGHRISPPWRATPAIPHDRFRHPVSRELAIELAT